jgi:hypothetical protein
MFVNGHGNKREEHLDGFDICIIFCSVELCDLQLVDQKGICFEGLELILKCLK